MSQSGPHISVPNKQLVHRVLGISAEVLRSWPSQVQDIAASLASELFIIRYNPFIPARDVKSSVFDRLQAERPGLEPEHFASIQAGLTEFWRRYLEDQNLKERIVQRLQQILPSEHIVTAPNALVECATDATDLRLEVPLLLVSPASTEEIHSIIELANELGFSIVPRGGGSGLTGGAVPSEPRSIVLSLSKMKGILSLDADKRLLCAQSGVITLNAMKAATEAGLLFTVDPASKASSSLGGNIAENAGGPFAFEYGTTLDNLYSYRMVMPDGRLIHVSRRSHPWHKILPEETAVFEILEETSGETNIVSLPGDQIRASGLGKDVSNKYLGGLPGIQKEGVDGIITEACFILHQKLPYSRTLCLEFFGHSMHKAMLVIRELVSLRDEIRQRGETVTMSALEEFGTKYVQAIEYVKKSCTYEGEPISVLLLQLDSDDLKALEATIKEIVHLADSYDQVDVFVADNDQEAERFWEDRHKLSAIARRTSGFKINEDVVIPIEVIPEFSDFIEGLNLFYLARSYRRALQQVTQLEEIDPADEFIDMELTFASRIISGRITNQKVAEQEFELQIHYFFRDLRSRYPDCAEDLKGIEDSLFANRIMVANHMHAGDGNCHVNIPVNSNDPEMLRLAREAAGKVFDKVLELNGSVSGEHGIGITKIDFLSESKIEALQAYKAEVDPLNILNPGKLTRKGAPALPYTFSFNRLIQDLDTASFPPKDKLIALLKTIQICSRCGKCKQVCPMYYPEKGFLYHPRNKIIALGALVEALFYGLVVRQSLDKKLLEQLQDILERCTACGKCTAVCPVHIDMPGQILNMRSFIEERASGGHHPVKSSLLHFLSVRPGALPWTAKTASAAMQLQHSVIGLLPERQRHRFSHPLLRGKAPLLDFRNLQESLQLDKGNLLLPIEPGHAQETPATFYFPGCGASLFSKAIGQASIFLLLKAGLAVLLPPTHLCCGYPLLAAGCLDDFQKNRQRNQRLLHRLFEDTARKGFAPSSLLTSCGTCREALQGYDFGLSPQSRPRQKDVLQYILEEVPTRMARLVKQSSWSPPERLLFQSACHAEWNGLPADASTAEYAEKLARLLDCRVTISPGCCGESGLGAMTSPQIFSTIQDRKRQQLQNDLNGYPQGLPVLVGCPSCKIGLSRISSMDGLNHEILHVTEFLAGIIGGRSWRADLKGMIAARATSPD